MLMLQSTNQITEKLSQSLIMNKITKLLAFLFITLISYTNYVNACSPCGALSNVTQNLNGTNLELTFTSNAGWQCCYTVRIEIVCENASFSGVPNYFSQEICINGGGASSSTWATPVPYPLTVIDVSGFCPGTYKWRAAETSCNIYTPEQIFTVAGASPILVSANLTEDTICSSQSSQFSASASNGCNNGTYNYSWSPSTGLNDANIANPIASPTVTTTYTLTVSENGSCTTPQTSDLTVTVNPTPTATISSTTSVCLGDSPPDLTITGSNGTGPYTIDYTLNGVAQTPIIADPTATISVPTGTAGTYTYSLTNVQDASPGQCTGTPSSTAIVTVNGLPTVDAGIDQILCDEFGTTATQTSLNGSGASTYTWNNSAVDGVLFTPPTGTTTYTVTGTDVNGCTDTDDVNVTAMILPSASISGSTTICQNSSSPSVTFNGQYGTAPYTISYTLNGVAQTPVVANTSFNLSVPTNTPGTYTYSLTDITDASGSLCDNNPASGSAVIVINPTPVVDAGEDQELCAPNGTSPSDVTLSGSGALTYSWSNGAVDGVAFTPPIGSTVYTVTGTDVNGCTDTDIVTITAYPLPIANGSPSDAYGNAPMTIEFTNLSQYANNYAWTFGNGDTQNTNSSAAVSTTYTTPGVYTIELIASNGICFDVWTTEIEVIPPMIVTPPNIFTPNGDEMNDMYFVNVDYGQYFEAIILNRWGNVLAELDQLDQGWDGKTNGKEVEDGVYYIKYIATDFNGEAISGHTYFHLVR